MDDNTTADIANLLESSGQSSQQPQSTGQESDQTLEEVLAHTSTDVIHTLAASINESAMRETGKTEKFTQELKGRLFRAMIRTYVWSTARLAHEMETNDERLNNGVQELLSAEREQGRSSPPPPTMLDQLRERLTGLMAAVSRAVEMFAQF